MKKLLNKTCEFVVKNKTTILAGIGCIGVVGTSVLTAKGAMKVSELIEEDMSKKEKAIVYATAYLPAFITGTATIACIMSGNILDRKQQASLMSSYALLDQAFKKYKKGVSHTFEAQEELEQLDEEEKTEELLFYDTFSGTYFNSTREKVLEAILDLNKLFVTGQFAPVNTFYDKVGIKYGTKGEYIGWDIDEMACNCDSYFIDHYTYDVTTDDGLECTVINWVWDPFINEDLHADSKEFNNALTYAKKHNIYIVQEDSQNKQLLL